MVLFLENINLFNHSVQT